jgi:hypothetical protein
MISDTIGGRLAAGASSSTPSISRLSAELPSSLTKVSKQEIGRDLKTLARIFLKVLRGVRCESLTGRKEAEDSLMLREDHGKFANQATTT